MANRTGYIGRNPADSLATIARQTFSPSGITTDFTFASGYTPGYFDLYINGVKMIEGSDYTASDGSTFKVLNGGVLVGDVLEGIAYKAFNAASAIIGVSSGGNHIGNVTSLNFVGTGHTLTLTGSSSIDINIAGGSGGGGGSSTLDGLTDVTISNLQTNEILKYNGSAWVNDVDNVGTAGTFGVNATGIHTTKNVGIGTTTADGAADTNNTTVLNAGIVTANNFYGAFTGNVTGNVTGDVTGNATGLSGSPSITVTNINAADITATGTLTYEDVTNVDSLGVGTFRNGLIVQGEGTTSTTLNVSGVSTFVGFTTFRDDVFVAGIVTATSFDGSVSGNVKSSWTLGANGTSDYTFTGPGLTGAENDPTLYLVRGEKYTFVNSMGAHPFRIQSTPNGSTGTQYNDGITNNDVSNGTLTWDVQFDSPDTLYYQCTAHPNMGGIIYIGNGLRNIPQNAQSSSYTLIQSDTGKHISITSGDITVSSGVHNIGDLITIYNNKNGNLNINGSGVTLRAAGTSSTGNRGVYQYGTASILCVDTNVFLVSGNIY